jgi:hypothetical protein
MKLTQTAFEGVAGWRTWDLSENSEAAESEFTEQLAKYLLLLAFRILMGRGNESVVRDGLRRASGAW